MHIFQNVCSYNIIIKHCLSQPNICGDSGGCPLWIIGFCKWNLLKLVMCFSSCFDLLPFLGVCFLINVTYISAADEEDECFKALESEDMDSM